MEIQATAVEWERERKGLRPGRKHHAVFAADMIVHVENPRESTGNHLTYKWLQQGHGIQDNTQSRKEKTATVNQWYI